MFFTPFPPRHIPFGEELLPQEQFYTRAFFDVVFAFPDFFPLYHLNIGRDRVHRAFPVFRSSLLRDLLFHFYISLPSKTFSPPMSPLIWVLLTPFPPFPDLSRSVTPRSPQYIFPARSPYFSISASSSYEEGVCCSLLTLLPGPSLSFEGGSVFSP